MSDKPSWRKRIAALMSRIFDPPTRDEIYAWADKHKVMRTTASVLLKVVRRYRADPLTNDDTFAILRKSYKKKDYPVLWIVKQILGFYFGQAKDSIADKWAPIGARIYMIYRFLRWVFTSI